MGDRRVADRRAPEEGVVKIETKKLVMYLIIGAVILIAIITSIIYAVLYHKYKESYDSITGTDEETYTNEVEDSLADDALDYTCDLLISGDKGQIKAGETITYEIKAENIKAGNGIVMFETILDYDKDSFDCEVITDDSMEWTKTSFIEDYLTMSRNGLLPSSENQTIAKVAFTAKENIQEGEQIIEFSNLNFITDEDYSFTLPDSSLNVNVVK